ncbi:hypothetical protein LSM04_009629 [Trypanosoma melophagium]|uniref:uncharacterized protein n=1 Tax=Trypanosoma melophagium TaxID=715481 RepID=UPI00351A7AB8|nr:hypothetical protein LSM04_009629 [Trypanosoma melophagium]
MIKHVNILLRNPIVRRDARREWNVKGVMHATKRINVRVPAVVLCNHDTHGENGHCDAKSNTHNCELDTCDGECHWECEHGRRDGCGEERETAGADAVARATALQQRPPHLLHACGGAAIVAENGVAQLPRLGVRRPPSPARSPGVQY